jgi:L-threonylcarbamoyladenylate synthase
MIVLVADDRDILQWVSAPDPLVFDYLENLTRPTTILFDGAVGLAHNLLAEDGSIGIRVVKDAFCRHLIKRFGKPIVSTSANRSGESAPAFYDAIASDIKAGVDYIVHYHRDDRTLRHPSSVVRWNKDGTITVLRP